ncbi:ribonuclease III [Candidatus Woesebacteria bacterium RBG_16_36_11]|uniref:Ribonuclease 3 n=3 Tax=Candidatus Woeseibacteriota TaxID=1752722 RepID=A0A1F7X792_9BACT|nr:MAG: ribonuclease III [Candidatus Woesebacteria bacterium RBG_13_36_22]OGM10917.1 MAG: ribonuclease III [Candidatus Woesebacteria bacterium RBG_16_36_11]OGM16887.1 MAG: ribonuclease III [Candidatus Woesebacteria bacterium RBG_19FT_COMBO_37_29]
MTDIDSLKEIFKDKKLLEQALTHKSWVNEHPGIRGTNERMEFLGDAILEFVVSKELYLLFPDKEEGYLTTLRANLVNTTNLSVIAKKLNVGEKLFLSKGEEETGGRNNVSLLADTVEALIGALFLDSGLDTVKLFIETNLLSGINEKLAKPLKDAKSRLQEYLQAKGNPAPKYIVAHESGPDHDKIFIVDVITGSKSLGKGEGKNKAEAEQNAAEKALGSLL